MAYQTAWEHFLKEKTKCFSQWSLASSGVTWKTRTVTQGLLLNTLTNANLFVNKKRCVEPILPNHSSWVILSNLNPQGGSSYKYYTNCRYCMYRSALLIGTHTMLYKCCLKSPFTFRYRSCRLSRFSGGDCLPMLGLNTTKFLPLPCSASNTQRVLPRGCKMQHSTV